MRLLPRAVAPPFAVFVNGVRQTEGEDYSVAGAELVFARELVQGGQARLLALVLGAWGIGTYRKDDQVDVAWDAGGHPHVAHKLDVRKRLTRRARRRATAPSAAARSGSRASPASG